MTYENVMNEPRWLTAGILALAIALVTVAPTLAQSAPDDDAFAYAQCVRDNGYPEFPDPDSEGRMIIMVEDRNAPRFQAAAEACRDLAPVGGRAMGGADPERMEQMLALAQCMRENGVPEFPDPDSNGQLPLQSANIDRSSPSVNAALEVCAQGTGGLPMVMSR